MKRLKFIFQMFMKVEVSSSKKNCFICFNETPLKMMKNALYFILTILTRKHCRNNSIQKIVKWESWLLLIIVDRKRSNLLILLLLLFTFMLKLITLAQVKRTDYSSNPDYLRILTGKNYSKIKLQRLRKIRIWTFGSLVHQTNSF